MAKGKQTEINREVNVILKKKYDIIKISHCEVGKFFDYKDPFHLCRRKRDGYAHDAKRKEFRFRQEDLATVKHTLSICNHCHQVIENDVKLTAMLFQELRGKIKEPVVRITDRVKKKFKSKKPEWMRDHVCYSCGAIVSGLICPKCKNLSIKS